LHMENINKVKIYKYIIKYAPTAELSYVLEDVKKLTNNQDILENPEIIKAIRDYHLSHLTHFQIDNDTRVIASEAAEFIQLAESENKKEQQKDSAEEQKAEGEDQDTHSKKVQEPKEESPNSLVFIDSIRRVKFRVDVHTGQAEILASNVIVDLPEQLVTFKDSLEKAVEKYIAKRYRENTTLAAVSLKIAEGGKIDLQLSISCHNVNLGNFWAGEWLSKWNASISKNGSATLNGSIHINDHYFESGNIQFKLEKAFENSALTLDIQDSESVADTIVKAVEKLEDQYQYSLDVMYETVSENFLKTMRRKLPVTGVKFNWAPKII